MGPPDGRYLAARSEDEKGLLPFNLHFLSNQNRSRRFSPFVSARLTQIPHLFYPAFFGVDCPDPRAPQREDQACLGL